MAPSDVVEDIQGYPNMMDLHYGDLDLNNGMMPDVFGPAMDDTGFDLQAVPFCDILDLHGGRPMNYPYDPTALTNDSSPAFSRNTPATPAMGYAAIPEKLQPPGHASGRAALGETQMRSLFPAFDCHDQPALKATCHALLESQEVQSLRFPERRIPPLTQRSGDPKNSSLTNAYDFDYLQSMLEHRPWPGSAALNPLTKEELESCIELYFVHFHPRYPVIHRPTFVVSEAPVVLVLAMAALGATLGVSSKLGDCLGEWTRRFLLLLTEYNPKHARADYWLTAQALQGIFARLSGNSKLFDFIEQLRGGLIDNAACVGYHQIEENADLTGKSVEEAWKIWIAEEKKARIVWLIFEYDASATVFFNARPYIRLAKLRTKLPCDQELWEAASAEEWGRLRQQHDLSGPFFPELLDQLSISEDDSLARSITNLYSLRLLFLAVARMQWTLKELPSSTPNYFARSKFWKTNNLAVDVARIMSFLSATVYSILKSGITPTKTLFGVANLHIAHMAHLQSAGELLDWLHPFLRGEHPERERVEQWRARWALQSYARVRQAAFNCGQLLGLARRYPACFMQQPYCTFHAGTILWAIAPFLHGPLSEEDWPFGPRVAPDPEKSNGIPNGIRCPPNRARRPLYLDEIPRLDALGKVITPAYASAVLHQQKELSGWLQPTGDDSTPYSAAIDGIPNVTSTEGRRKVLEVTMELLRNPAFAGIAERFCAVIEHLLGGQAKVQDDGLTQRHSMLMDR